MDTPVLFLVFNRPEQTKRVFETIKKAKPKQLFIAADGPRLDKENEDQVCENLRNWLLNNIDWDCDLQTRFQDKNMGCGKHVSSAISWFFENVEDGIILEDDCLPNITFFGYCKELLTKYKTDKTVYQIAGSNWQQGKTYGNGDYFFSAFSSVWGWATWRDRWSDYTFQGFQEKFDRQRTIDELSRVCKNDAELQYHLSCFQKTANGEIDTWDYQWRHCMIMHHGLNTVPNVNLISNIGHGDDATHTMSSDHWRADLQTEEINLPLEHPNNVEQDKIADSDLADFVWLASTSKTPTSNYNIIKRLWSRLTNN